MVLVFHEGRWTRNVEIDRRSRMSQADSQSLEDAAAVTVLLVFKASSKVGTLDAELEQTIRTSSGAGSRGWHCRGGAGAGYKMDSRSAVSLLATVATLALFLTSG